MSSGDRRREYTTVADPLALLDRLESVREVGPDQWMTRCPAHEDRTPSLSIRRVDDRLLIHCFAGCPPGDIVAACGLSVGDLFDHPPTPCRPGRVYRHRPDARRLLAAIKYEVTIITLLARDILAGFSPTADDLVALERAERHLSRVVEATHG